MKRGYGSAPGKVILTGEHSVVYGYPALAASIDLRCSVISDKRSDEKISVYSQDLNYTVTYPKEELDRIAKGEIIGGKFDNIALAAFTTSRMANSSHGVNINISSKIPVSAGLGSSAAVVVATIASVTDLFSIELDKKKISAIAFESEKITHGKPSGIDNSIATYGGLLRFKNGELSHKTLVHSIPILIGNTKIPRNTKKLVGDVGILKNTYPNIINPILATMGSLVDEFEDALNSNDLVRIGKLMNINQGLLDAIGVGHQVIADYIWKAIESGALGAKLTGAGGGGCMIALASNEENQKEISQRLQGKEFDILPANLTDKGVVIGSE